MSVDHQRQCRNGLGYAIHSHCKFSSSNRRIMSLPIMYSRLSRRSHGSTWRFTKHVVMEAAQVKVSVSVLRRRSKCAERPKWAIRNGKTTRASTTYQATGEDSTRPELAPSKHYCEDSNQLHGPCYISVQTNSNQGDDDPIAEPAQVTKLYHS